MNQPGYFGDAGGPVPGFSAQIGGQAAAQVQSSSIDRQAAAMAKEKFQSASDRPPAEASISRLFERLAQLQAEADMLTDRLQPVLRSEGPTGKAIGEDRLSGDCQLLEVLEQAIDRVEITTYRLGNARNRLCI